MQVAVVSGASSGIGRAVAESSAATGLGFVPKGPFFLTQKLLPLVNAVAPGSTRPRIAGDALASLASEQLADIADGVALGRVGEPADIGRVIAFLAGGDSAWITGEIIECSGGQGL